MSLYRKVSSDARLDGLRFGLSNVSDFILEALIIVRLEFGDQGTRWFELSASPSRMSINGRITCDQTIPVNFNLATSHPTDQ